MSQTASKRFDKIASSYAQSEVHSMSPSIKRLHEILPLKSGLTLCDIACGAGHLGLSFSEYTQRLVGVDPAPSMLHAFQNIANERGINIETVEAYAEAIPLPDNTFDLVTSRLAPHHFSDIQNAVKEMARITQPGGYIAVIDLEGHPDPYVDDFNHQIELLHDPTHCRSYIAQQWKVFFEEAGLVIDNLESGHKERPQGLPLSRWCEIASSGEEAEKKIRQTLEAAPKSILEALDISRKNGEFFISVRTVLIVGRKP